MDWNKPQHIEDNKYELPGNWLLVHYFEAFNILFRLENSLRIFVYLILKDVFKEKWLDLNVTSDDEASSTISAIAKKRINQDNNFAYLGYTTTNPLMYLTSGELIRIITSENYWKYFNGYFQGSKEVMKIKLDEIGNVRNALAHFRPIKDGDVEVLKQNAKHTLQQIEKTIAELVECRDIMPSNNAEPWFLALKTLGSEKVQLKFGQSSDGKWIKVTIGHQSTIIGEKETFSNYFTFRTTRLKINELLRDSSNLTKHMLCCREWLPYSHFDLKKPVFKKIVAFTFSRDCLQKTFEPIKIELERILAQISNETELIVNDDLAKGTYIDLVDIVAERDQTTGHIDVGLKNLLSPGSKGDLPEFWGQISYFPENFISNIEKFPWMPVEISDDKGLPF